MLSLRTFHLVFVLIAIVAADMFGAWSIAEYMQTRDAFTLAWGILCFAVGFGLIGYGIWVVRKLDKAHIE